MLKKNYLWLLPCCMAVATYFCYEKVHRRTTRTAIVSYLLKTVTLFRLISTAWNVQIRSFCWSVFSRIRTEYGKVRSISPYSVQMRENTPYLSVFSSTAGKYEVSLRIQSECRKIRTRKNSDLDTFHAVKRHVSNKRRIIDTHIRLSNAL